MRGYRFVVKMEIDNNQNSSSAKSEETLKNLEFENQLQEKFQLETDETEKCAKVNTLHTMSDSSSAKRKRTETTIKSEQDNKESESDIQAKKLRRTTSDTMKEDTDEPSSRDKVNESWSMNENSSNNSSEIENKAEESLNVSVELIENTDEVFSDGNSNNNNDGVVKAASVKIEQQVDGTKENEQCTSEAEPQVDKGEEGIANNQDETSESKGNERETCRSPKDNGQSVIATDKSSNDEQVSVTNEKTDILQPIDIKQEIVEVKQEFYNPEDEKYIERQKVSTMKRIIANIVESSNEGVKRKFSEEMEVLRAQLVDARAERRRAQNLEQMVNNLKDENRKLKDELEKERGQRKNFEREIIQLEGNIKNLQGQKRLTSGIELGGIDVKYHEHSKISLSDADNDTKGWGITIKNDRCNRAEEPLAANKRHPLPLPRSEVDIELQERERRLNNVVLKGMDYIGRKTLNKVSLMMEEEIGWRVKIQEVTQIGSKTLLLKMESKKDKTELMSNRSRFLKWGLTLENDLTSREKEVQDWIQDIVETEQARGKESHAKHLRVFLKGKWYLWDEKKAKLV